MILYLASTSPRRAALLRQIGVSFEPLGMAVDETRHRDEDPDTYVARLARQKALAGAAEVRRRGLPDGLVLGADTAVVLDERVLGKPDSRQMAYEMLRQLSGRSHVVLTGIAFVRTPDELLVEHEQRVLTQVTFDRLTDAEIETYLDGEKPWDKAGAYAIQGRAAAFVSHLAGSYTNVVGLPLREVQRALREIGRGAR